MQRREFLAAVAAASCRMAASEEQQSDIRRARSSVAGETVASPEQGYADPAQGLWRRLFLDATVVEESAGLARVFHQASKLSANPIIKRDRPWEAGTAVAGPYVYGTVLEDGGRYRLWYQLIMDGQHVGYAESRDGIEWRKPNLGLLRGQTDRKNNLVVSDWDKSATGGSCHNPSVVCCPWEQDPARRYRLYGFDYSSGARLAFSPDGLRWRYSEDAAARPLFRSSDVVNVFRDSLRSRFAATWKAQSRRGRSVGVAVSDDGIHWSKPVDGPVFIADDLDLDATQVYGMPVFPYQGLYIGLAWMYRARYVKVGRYSPAAMLAAQASSPRTVDVELAWSWDLVNWTRTPDRKPFIPRGDPGDFDAAMIYTARAPIRVQDELWFYYGGCLKAHDEPRDEAAIGLARLRLDGFCSMRADDREGMLVSRTEAPSVPAVTINARTHGDGFVVAELLDSRNRVVPGFSRDQCKPFAGDSVQHVLRWDRDRFPATMQRQPVRLRFFLRNADLYAYAPQEVWEQDFDVTPATAGP